MFRQAAGSAGDWRQRWRPCCAGIDREGVERGQVCSTQVVNPQPRSSKRRLNILTKEEVPSLRRSFEPTVRSSTSARRLTRYRDALPRHRDGDAGDN